MLDLMMAPRFGLIYGLKSENYVKNIEFYKDNAVLNYDRPQYKQFIASFKNNKIYK